MGVTENDTDLGRGGTLLRELADLLDDLVGRGLEPRRGGARVGNRRGRNTLSVAVKTTHFDDLRNSTVSRDGRVVGDVFLQEDKTEKLLH